MEIQDQMAKTPEAATKLMNQIATPAVETARREAKDIQDLIDQQKGGFKVEPWDWNFYAEQVRKAKFDLDESEINLILKLQPFWKKEFSSLLKNSMD
jgi:peptidyl-dipeptidase Dcp